MLVSQWEPGGARPVAWPRHGGVQCEASLSLRLPDWRPAPGLGGGRPGPHRGRHLHLRQVAPAECLPALSAGNGGHHTCFRGRVGHGGRHGGVWAVVLQVMTVECLHVLEHSTSSYDREEDCRAGCHSLTGQDCLWRQSLTTKGHNYSSCSPPIGSCLDGSCDAFEELSPSLCPQDCYSPDKGSHIQIASNFLHSVWYIFSFFSLLTTNITAIWH